MRGNNYYGRMIGERRVSRRALLGAAGLGAAFLAACGGSDKSNNSGASSAGSAAQGTASGTQAAAIKRGGKLKYSGGESFTTLDPTYSSSYMDLFVSFEPLLGLDPDGKPGITDASLASSLEQVDQTTLVVKLRDGIKFHDNTELNSQAVKFSLDRAIADKPTGQPWKSTLINYDRVEPTDTKTARVILKKPDGSMTLLLADVAGMMISPTLYADKPLEAVAWTTGGTGPYRLTDHRLDSFRAWERFPDYWRKLSDGGTAALLDTIESDEIPDPTVKVASLQSGQLDLVFSNSPDPAPGVLDDDPNLKASRRDGYGLQVLMMNHALPPLDNADFRRGLAWAIDRQTVSKSLYRGSFDGNVHSFLSPASWAYKQAKDFPGFDVDKAKGFIDRSGVAPADRKVLVTNSSAADFSQGFALFQAMLAKVGVQAVFVDYAQAKGRMYKNTDGKAEIHLIHFPELNKIDPNLLCAPYLTSGGVFNASGMAIGNMDDLVARATSTYDINERKSLYGQIQDLQSQEMGYMIPLAVRPARQWAKKSVTGVTFRPGSGWPFFGGLGLS